MTNERLTQVCREVFATQVYELFERAPTLVDVFAELPFDAASCFKDWRDSSCLRALVINALVARAWFDLQKPAWAPQLPLDAPACRTLVDDPDNRLKMLGWFGHSLRGVEWDYYCHPSFCDYGRTALTLPGAPEELRREFPSQWLVNPEGAPVLLPDWRHTKRRRVGAVVTRYKRFRGEFYARDVDRR